MPPSGICDRWSATLLATLQHAARLAEEFLSCWFTDGREDNWAFR
jgi:hypothetical protein